MVYNKTIKNRILYSAIAVALILIALFFVLKNKPKTDMVKNTESDIKAIDKKITLPEDILKKEKFTYIKMEERGISEEINLPGKVSYDMEKMAEVGSRVSGRIINVFVKEGDLVNAGAPLVSIASIELGKAQEQYLKSKARLETIKVQLERAEELYTKEKIISAKEFEAVQTEYKTLKTEVDVSYSSLLIFGYSKAEISSLEKGSIRQQELLIRSPIRGTVTKRNAIIGQSVNSQENMFVIADLKKLWILLDLYEKDLNQIKIGTEATIFTYDNKTETINGVIANVGQIIDPQTHTAKVRIEVDNSEFKLKPGQTISARVMGLMMENKSKKLNVLPSESVHKIEGKNYAFVANSDGSFSARELELGSLVDNFTEIKSGLTYDDTVVVYGSFILKSALLK